MLLRTTLALAFLAACSPADLGAADPECPGPDCPGCPGPECGLPPQGKSDTADYNELNQSAGGLVLYEVQARTANACHPQVGADRQRQACAARVAPDIGYHAEGRSEHWPLARRRFRR